MGYRIPRRGHIEEDIARFRRERAVAYMVLGALLVASLVMLLAIAVVTHA